MKRPALVSCCEEGLMSVTGRNTVCQTVILPLCGSTVCSAGEAGGWEGRQSPGETEGEFRAGRTWCRFHWQLGAAAERVVPFAFQSERISVPAVSSVLGRSCSLTSKRDTSGLAAVLVFHEAKWFTGNWRKATRVFGPTARKHSPVSPAQTEEKEASCRRKHHVPLQ